MLDTKLREIAETVFERNQQPGAQVNNALTQEAARRAAALKNMERLRALRLERDRAQTRKDKT
jgi:hypothetical protein